MSNDWLAVVCGVGLIAYALLGFIVSAVVAATTKTGWTDHYKDVGPGRPREWVSTDRYPSGWFSVWAGGCWPITVIVVCATWSVKFAGRRLRPGRQWLRLVHRMNPGADVRW